jgi:hypothetical protein
MMADPASDTEGQPMDIEQAGNGPRMNGNV